MKNSTNNIVKVSVFIPETKAKDLKKRAIEEGKSLSAWITDLPEIPHTPKRSELIEELAIAIEELYPLLEKKAGGNRSMGVFLHQSINLYAADESIVNIIADVKKFLKRFKAKTQNDHDK